VEDGRAQAFCFAMQSAFMRGGKRLGAVVAVNRSRRSRSSIRHATSRTWWPRRQFPTGSCREWRHCIGAGATDGNTIADLPDVPAAPCWKAAPTNDCLYNVSTFWPSAVDGDVGRRGDCNLSDGRARFGKIADTLRNHIDSIFVNREKRETLLFRTV